MAEIAYKHMRYIDYKRTVFLRTFRSTIEWLAFKVQEGYVKTKNWHRPTLGDALLWSFSKTRVGLEEEQRFGFTPQNLPNNQNASGAYYLSPAFGVEVIGNLGVRNNSMICVDPKLLVLPYVRERVLFDTLSFQIKEIQPWLLAPRDQISTPNFLMLSFIVPTFLAPRERIFLPNGVGLIGKDPTFMGALVSIPILNRVGLSQIDPTFVGVLTKILIPHRVSINPLDPILLGEQTNVLMTERAALSSILPTYFKAEEASLIKGRVNLFAMTSWLLAPRDQISTPNLVTLSSIVPTFLVPRNSVKVKDRVGIATAKQLYLNASGLIDMHTLVSISPLLSILFSVRSVNEVRQRERVSILVSDPLFLKASGKVTEKDRIAAIIAQILGVGAYEYFSQRDSDLLTILSGVEKIIMQDSFSMPPAQVTIRVGQFVFLGLRPGAEKNIERNVIRMGQGILTGFTPYFSIPSYNIPVAIGKTFSLKLEYSCSVPDSFVPTGIYRGTRVGIKEFMKIPDPKMVWTSHIQGRSINLDSDSYHTLDLVGTKLGRYINLSLEAYPQTTRALMMVDFTSSLSIKGTEILKTFDGESQFGLSSFFGRRVQITNFAVQATNWSYTFPIKTDTKGSPFTFIDNFLQKGFLFERIYLKGMGVNSFNFNAKQKGFREDVKLVLRKAIMLPYGFREGIPYKDIWGIEAKNSLSWDFNLKVTSKEPFLTLNKTSAINSSFREKALMHGYDLQMSNKEAKIIHLKEQIRNSKSFKDIVNLEARYAIEVVNHSSMGVISEFKFKLLDAWNLYYGIKDRIINTNRNSLAISSTTQFFFNIKNGVLNQTEVSLNEAIGLVIKVKTELAAQGFGIQTNQGVLIQVRELNGIKGSFGSTVGQAILPQAVERLGISQHLRMYLLDCSNIPAGIFSTIKQITKYGFVKGTGISVKASSLSGLHEEGFKINDSDALPPWSLGSGLLHNLENNKIISAKALVFGENTLYNINGNAGVVNSSEQGFSYSDNLYFSEFAGFLLREEYHLAMDLREKFSTANLFGFTRRLSQGKSFGFEKTMSSKGRAKPTLKDPMLISVLNPINNNLDRINIEPVKGWSCALIEKYRNITKFQIEFGGNISLKTKEYFSNIEHVGIAVLHCNTWLQVETNVQTWESASSMKWSQLVGQVQK